MTHSARIPFETLLDYVEGRLPAEQTAALASRIPQADQATRRDLAWLQSFHELHRTGALEPAPMHVRVYLRQRFRRWAAQRPPQPGLLQRVQAALRFDSLAAAALAGARDLQLEAGMRQFLYESDLANIELYVMADAAGLRLLGQVLPSAEEEDLAGWVVTLRDAAGDIHYAVTNDLGEFRFYDVMPGPASLTITESGREIVLEDVKLGGEE